MNFLCFQYVKLAQAGGIVGPSESHQRALEALIGRLESSLRLAGIACSLAEVGVSHEAIPTLADEAAQQWTAAFNPRELSSADFVRLYETAF